MDGTEVPEACITCTRKWHGRPSAEFMIPDMSTRPEEGWDETSQDLTSCGQLLLYDSNVQTGFFPTFMVPNQRNSHLFPSDGQTSLAGCVTCEDRIHSNMASLRDFRRQLGPHNICAFPADYRLYTITQGCQGCHFSVLPWETISVLFTLFQNRP